MDDDVARCVAFARARGATELVRGRLRDARATMDALRAKDATTTLGAIGWGKTLGARVRIAREARSEARDEATRVAPVFASGTARETGATTTTTTTTKTAKAKPKPKPKPKPPAKAKAKAKPPAWIRPPGTTFIVDGFEYAASSEARCEHWFLTHFHADHHRGLTRTFDRGVVYGTRTTMELVRTKIGVQRERLRVVEFGVVVRVDGVDVTFLRANHCPGAAMICFEFPHRRDASPVLHTGDFRFHDGMRNDPTLLRITSDPSAPRPILILDTTYCSLEHDDFPTQERVLKAVRDAVVHEDLLSTRKLFLFGTYTIGKEKVFLEAAKVLNRKVYIGKAKRSVMDAIALDPEERSAMTHDDSKTNLHVVPMGSTSFMKMASILKYYKSRFDTVIAFRPTGWTFSAQKKTARATSRRQRGRLIQYGLPYSEHSSLNELREFVRFMNPKFIFPHVNNDGGENAKRMLTLLRASEDEYAEMRRGR